MRQNEKAKAVFALFDKDGKGLVCLDNVARVASELGETFTDDELEEMMNEADPSGEGLIDQKGFFRIVRQLNLWIPRKNPSEFAGIPGENSNSFYYMYNKECNEY